jgi:SAM-dependent methyltransferase
MPNTVEGLYWKGYEGQDYEQFWQGPAKQYVDELEHAIASHCLRGGDSVVEVGAGFGRLGNCYVGKYRTAHMVEPASNLRAIARRTYGPAVEYHEAHVEKLPFQTDSIDAVLMVRVFHHLGDPAAALHEIRRVLRPGGVLVFNYSNKRNLMRIARFAVGRGTSPFNDRMEKYYDFLIGHHPAHVEKLLGDDGFDIQEQYGVGVVDKLVGAVPSLGKVLKPSLSFSRVLGSLKVAPAQFVVAVKR